MTRRVPRRLLAAVAAAGLAIALTACDSDGRRAAPAASTTTTTTVAPTVGGAQPPPPTTAAPAQPPPTSEGPTAVAAALVSSEGAIRNRQVPLHSLERHARAQQEAYRQLVEHPEWLEPTLAAVPAGLRATVRANVSAGAELRALNKPRTALPAWRIVAPAPAEELLRYYRQAQEEIGVPWTYLAAIHLVETRMGRIRGTSVAGAQGPMQFLPATWRQYGRGGDINSNRDAIFAAARLLDANGAPENMSNALFNYNRSQRYVRAVTAYATQMQADERAYFGYYHWQVYYRMVDGDRLLPVGYGS